MGSFFQQKRYKIEMVALVWSPFRILLYDFFLCKGCVPSDAHPSIFEEVPRVFWIEQSIMSSFLYDNHSSIH